MSSHENVRDIICERIRSGQYRPNARIPSQAEMATEFTVSRRSIAKAIKELREQNYVWTLPHKGSYCAPRCALFYIPGLAGGTQRIVLGPDDLPEAERFEGKIACQETGDHAQVYGVMRRGARVIWRKLDCLNPNLQTAQAFARRKDT